MPDQDSEFALLLQRLEGLGRADRKAVLSAMSAEDRVAFDQAVEAEAQERLAEEERRRRADRQFHGYSPWLAGIVEAAVKGDGGKLSPATARAVGDEHAALLASEKLEDRSPLGAMLAKVQALFAPQGGSPR